MLFPAFLASAMLGVPVGCTAAIGLWARWLSRREGVPRVASYVGYGIAALGAAFTFRRLVLVILAYRSFASRCPAPLRQVLASGIAEVFYDGLLGVAFALVGGAWLGFWTWRGRRPS